MRPCLHWTEFFPAEPVGRNVYGRIWAIQSWPSMPRQLKAYTAQLAVSKLMFPEPVTDLILEYGCKVNNYLLVLSTPSHITFEVWAMWAVIPDIRWGLRVRAYMRRFLGSWNYNYLLSSLCVTGPGTKLSWIEAVVDVGYHMWAGGRVRYRKDKVIHRHILRAVSFVYMQRRLGRWVIDGENPGIPLYKALFLH